MESDIVVLTEQDPIRNFDFEAYHHQVSYDCMDSCKVDVCPEPSPRLIS